MCFCVGLIPASPAPVHSGIRPILQRARSKPVALMVLFSATTGFVFIFIAAQILLLRSYANKNMFTFPDSSMDFATYPASDNTCSGQPTSATNYPTVCTLQSYQDQNSFKWYCGSTSDGGGDDVGGSGGGGGGDDGGNDDPTSSLSTFLTIIIIVVVLLACGSVAACVGGYFSFVYSRGISDGTTLSVSANGQPMVNPLTAELPVYNNQTDGVGQEMVPNTNA